MIAGEKNVSLHDGRRTNRIHKKWWKQYSSLIMIVLSVILLSIAGYRYWTWHQEKLTFQASNNYEQMMLAYSNQDMKSVNAFANQLIKNHKTTVYADAAQLLKAKLFVNANELDKAKERLNQVINNTNIPALKQVARLRLARILTAEKSHDKALSELKTIEDQTYLPVINELRGDIYAARGQYKKASESYQLAMNDNRLQGLGNLYLEMKTNEMASMTQTMQPAHQKHVAKV